VRQRACRPLARHIPLRSHQQGVPFFPNLTPAMASLPPCSAAVPAVGHACGDSSFPSRAVGLRFLYRGR